MFVKSGFCLFNSFLGRIQHHHHHHCHSRHADPVVVVEKVTVDLLQIVADP